MEEGGQKKRKYMGMTKLRRNSWEGEMMDKATEGKHYVWENRAMCVLHVHLLNVRLGSLRLGLKPLPLEWNVYNVYK